MSNLEVHHKEFRGHFGDDSEDNLITGVLGLVHSKSACHRRHC